MRCNTLMYSRYIPVWHCVHNCFEIFLGNIWRRHWYRLEAWCHNVLRIAMCDVYGHLKFCLVISILLQIVSEINAMSSTSFLDPPMFLFVLNNVYGTLVRCSKSLHSSICIKFVILTSRAFNTDKERRLNSESCRHASNWFHVWDHWAIQRAYNSLIWRQLLLYTAKYFYQ